MKRVAARCDKKKENAFKRSSFISPSTSPFRRLQLVHSPLEKKKKNATIIIVKKHKKNQKMVRNLLNKSYPLPPPASLLFFCANQRLGAARSCQRAPPALPAAPILGKFGGLEAIRL